MERTVEFLNRHNFQAIVTVLNSMSPGYDMRFLYQLIVGILVAQMASSHVAFIQISTSSIQV